MALQTMKSASTGQGPAPTDPPSPPPPDNHSDNNPLSPAGSPPLILAFLAIGLFAAAMVTVFGFRRVQHVRAFGVRASANGSSTDEPALPRPKPRLWEVGLHDGDSWHKDLGYEGEKYEQSSWHWAKMMPLAANAVTTTLSQLPQDSKNPTTTIAEPQRENFLDTRVLGFSRGRMAGPLPHWTIPASRPEVSRSTRSSSETHEDTVVSKTLQVGTIILMPSPTNPVHRKQPDKDKHHITDRTRDDWKIPDYSIGFYERDWR